MPINSAIVSNYQSSIAAYRTAMNAVSATVQEREDARLALRQAVGEYYLYLADNGDPYGRLAYTTSQEGDAFGAQIANRMLRNALIEQDAALATDSTAYYLSSRLCRHKFFCVRLGLHSGAFKEQAA